MSKARKKTKVKVKVRKAGRAKHVPVVKRPIITPSEQENMDAALGSPEMEGSVQRWSRIFGMWGGQILFALLLCVGARAQGTANIVPVSLQQSLVPVNATVTCREQAQVGTEKVTLADVAEIVTGDPALETALAGIDLGPSPLLGQSRPLSRALIAARLQQAGYAPTAVALEGPTTVSLSRAAQEVPRTDLEAHVRELLPATLGQSADALIIENLRVPDALTLPPGAATWDMQVSGNHRPTGPIAFELIARNETGEIGRVQGMAQVDVAVSLVQTVGDVPRGTTLSAEMIQTIQGTLRQAPAGALTDPQAVIGQMATQNLRAGAVLTDRNVSTAVLVRRGETVTMIFESGGLRITDRAQATQDGGAGDQIAVRNLQSQRMVQALVTGPRTVRVMN